MDVVAGSEKSSVTVSVDKHKQKDVPIEKHQLYSVAQGNEYGEHMLELVLGEKNSESIHSPLDNQFPNFTLFCILSRTDSAEYIAI